MEYPKRPSPTRPPKRAPGIEWKPLPPTPLSVRVVSPQLRSPHKEPVRTPPPQPRTGFRSKAELGRSRWAPYQKELPNGMQPGLTLEPIKHDYAENFLDLPSPKIQKTWPAESRTLADNAGPPLPSIIGDVFSIFLPMAFLVLCGLAATLDGQEIEHNAVGKGVEIATSLGPTAFSILFAAAASRALRSLAHYCAEKGARLGNLELLVSSQNVWSTIESQLLLRRFSVVGLNLLLLWAVSPLGSQASLRLLNQVDSTGVSTEEARYFSTGSQAEAFNFFERQSAGAEDSEDDVSLAALNGIYAASLVAPSHLKLSNRDPWGNLKIPRIEYLERSTPPDQDGWVPSRPAVAPEDYVSLVGFPLVGLASTETFFSLQASYITLTCPDMKNYSMVDYGKRNSHLWSRRKREIFAEKDSLYQNNLFTAKPQSIRSFTFFLDTHTILDDPIRIAAENGWQLNETDTKNPVLNIYRDLVLGTTLPPLESPRGIISQIGVTNCTMAHVHVEAMVNCTAQHQCQVDKMRRSRIDKRPPQVTPFEHKTTTLPFLLNLPGAAGSSDSSSSTPSEIFMMDSSRVPYRTIPGAITNLSSVPPEKLAARLGVLLNTYYQISLSPTAYLTHLSSNLSDYGIPAPKDGSTRSKPSKHQVTEMLSLPMITYATTVTVKSIARRYASSWTWISLLAVCAGILLFISIAGLVIKFKTIAPAMLGHVSSMTYNNPFVELPRGPGPFDAMERARLLWNMKVKIADGDPIARNGRLALVSLGDVDGSINRDAKWKAGDLDKTRRFI